MIIVKQHLVKSSKCPFCTQLIAHNQEKLNPK